MNLIEFVKRDNYCDKDQGETDEFVLFPRRLLTRSWRHIRRQLLPSSLFPGLVGKDDAIDFEENFREKKKQKDVGKAEAPTHKNETSFYAAAARVIISLKDILYK